jgi:hypothetical protein
VGTWGIIQGQPLFRKFANLGIRFMVNAPSSERASKAIARMNYLHSKHQKAGKISNEDLLYTLSVCITEPTRFINMYEFRELNEMEIAAVGTFWKSVGDGMEIKYGGCLARSSWKDGIEFVEDITQWAKSYEMKYMVPAKTNAITSERSMAMMLYHVPNFAKPFAEEVFTVLMGDRVREAFG